MMTQPNSVPSTQVRISLLNTAITALKESQSDNSREYHTRQLRRTPADLQVVHRQLAESQQSGARVEHVGWAR